MGNMCLESAWKNALTKDGWSIDSATQFIALWQPSTLSSYSRSLDKLDQYCKNRGEKFPCVSTPVLADYLCSVARASDRPKSSLNTTVAALSCLSDALSIRNPVTPKINKLVTGLVKCNTNYPMERSKEMPAKLSQTCSCHGQETGT